MLVVGSWVHFDGRRHHTQGSGMTCARSESASEGADCMTSDRRCATTARATARLLHKERSDRRRRDGAVDHVGSGLADVATTRQRILVAIRERVGFQEQATLGLE
jgi:hypothetical protein